MRRFSSPSSSSASRRAGALFLRPSLRDTATPSLARSQMPPLRGTCAPVHSRMIVLAPGAPCRRQYASTTTLDLLKKLRSMKGDQAATTIHRPTPSSRAPTPQATPFQNDWMKPISQFDWNAKLPHLPPINKVDYTEHPSVADMTPEQVQQLRKESDIEVVRGNDKCPKPIKSFSESGLPIVLTKQLARAGFTQPTAIQSQGIPVAAAGFDMIGRAETGSGKTLAFLLPACMHASAQAPVRPTEGPIVLVLAPTRELVMQIGEEARKFAFHSQTGQRIKIATIFGGNPRGPQYRELKAGPTIVIATPGRLIDFLDSSATNLQRVSYLVLDEADRMLDMGFEPQIRRILSHVRPDKQTLMWSATWPKEVEALADQFLKDPIQINIGALGLVAGKNITQIIDIVQSSHEKMEKLKLMLEDMHANDSKVLIFSQTQSHCDILSDNICAMGFRANSIHGGKTQAHRESVLSSFKSGRAKILVATDVAARGLDVKDIDYVINYDFPATNETYIHRIGRTGRAGAKGVAYSFLTPKERSGKDAAELVFILEEAGQEVPEELRQLAGSHSHHQQQHRFSRQQSYGDGTKFRKREYGNKQFARSSSSDTNGYYKTNSANRSSGASKRNDGPVKPWELARDDVPVRKPKAGVSHPAAEPREAATSPRARQPAQSKEQDLSFLFADQKRTQQASE